MYKQNLILLIFFFLSFGSFGQVQEEKIPRVGFAINILGTSGLFGGTIDVLVSKRMMIEIGGVITGYGAGFSVFQKKINASKNPHFYAGLKYNTIVVVDGEENDRVYLPLGLMLFDKNKLLFAGIDLGPAYTRHLSSGYGGDRNKYPFNTFDVFGNLKIGFRL